MFAKSKRFNDQVPATPAVGEYDILKAPLLHGGAIFFPKDKRFKEPAITNDGALLDISNCSTASTRSTSSLNHGVFVTPGKPIDKAKNKGNKAKLLQTGANDESRKFVVKIAELQEEIENLRAENEMLHKLKDGDINEEERQAMESNLAALNDEVGHLRTQIENEMEKNKELVYQQSNYECSIKTMQADLELANSHVAALHEQVNSLEQMNLDITENREELKNQCKRLHGINIALQEEKLETEDRLEQIETKWKNACATQEQLSAEVLTCREGHQLKIETLEQSLKEALANVGELKAAVESYKQQIDHQKLEMDESSRKQMDSINKLKSEKENLHVLFENLKQKNEQDSSHLQEVIKRKEELYLENLGQCKDLENQIVMLGKNKNGKVESLTVELRLMKSNLEKREVELQTVNEVLQEMRTKYENECQTCEQMKRDLHVLNREKEYADNEIVEAQRLIRVLRENEQEQRRISETLTTNLEACNVTIENMNKMNQEYQDTIEENGRKVQGILESLRIMTEKCRTLENQFGLSQQTQTREVEKLTNELELSKTSLMNRNVEYETINETLKDMKESYDDVCRQRVQLKHKLQVVTHDKSTVDRELSEARQNEMEQRSAVETLKKKLESLERERERVQSELTKHHRNEIESIEEQLSNMEQENRSLAVAEEKAVKLKNEFGRRLIESQKNLSQKEMELQSYKKDIENLIAASEGHDSWKRKFEELEEKIAPFQEQLDAYELEKQALLNRNTESQSEIDKLGEQYARLLGHQNQKQKIRHVQKLKDENASLKKEVAKLREEVSVGKFSRQKLEEKLSKPTGTRRFDPSLAFKHSSVENKENTPLKERKKV